MSFLLPLPNQQPNMPKLFILLAALIGAQVASSQHKLSGIVTDSLTGKGVNKIYVSLIAAGTKDYYGVTDSIG